MSSGGHDHPARAENTQFETELRSFVDRSRISPAMYSKGYSGLSDSHVG